MKIHLSFNWHMLPTLIFHLVFAWVFISNFPFEAGLTGWDAVHPEFNFWLNLKRSLTAVWQENYGVGSLTGHGFGGLLPHTLLAGLLNLVLPHNWVRPSMVLLCWYLGGLGVFFLVKKLLAKNNFLGQLSALMASFYYMFNLGTVQLFYLPLEAFTFHFAALPWMAWSMIRLFEKFSKKRFAIFIIIQFVSAVQGFVPSVFATYAMIMFILVASYFVSSISLKRLRQVVLVGLGLVVIHSYWWVPLVFYSSGGHHNEFLQSYNNLSSTSEFVEKNQKYGRLSDVMLLRGFYWEGYQLDGYVFEPWILHHQKPEVEIIGYGFVVLAIVGAIYALLSKQKLRWFFLGLGILTVVLFGLLASDVMPFSWIRSFAFEFSPTLEQAFRSGFTKFSLGLAFSYAVFIGLGIFAVAKFVQNSKKLKVSGWVISVLGGLLILYYGLPALSGNFLYKELKISIPDNYYKLAAFLNTQENGRIAEFHQDCAEGWFAYSWGYFGSGFYWYMVEDPILARTFDVWDYGNEQYYWLIVQALREGNFSEFDRIINKYQVKRLIFDPNKLHCSGDGADFKDDDILQLYVEQSPLYKEIGSFEQIGLQPVTVYERLSNDEGFVRMTSEVPLKIAPRIDWYDQLPLKTNANFQFVQDGSEADLITPYRGLFSKRGTLGNLPVEIWRDGNELIFRSEVYFSSEEDLVLEIAPYTDFVNEVFGVIKVMDDDLVFEPLLPSFTVQGLELPLTDVSSAVLIEDFDYSLEFGSEDPVFILNGEKLEYNTDRQGYMGRFFFDDKNLLEVTFGDLTAIELGGEGLNFKNLLSKTSHKDIRLQRGAQEFVTTVPLWMDDSRFGVMLEAGNLEIKNCGTDGLFYAEQSADMDQSILWLKSRNSRLCAMSYLEGLFPGLDYVFEMNTIGDGQPLRLWVKNAAESLYLDTRIPNSDSLLSSYLFLPRTFTDEVGYELTLENRSFSFDEVEHGIKNISAWLVPGKYLQSLLLVKNEETRREESSYIEIDVAHPLETIYRINLPGVQVLDKARSIILAQGFDPFWIGVGRFQDGWMILPGHQRLNGWEQMWAVPDNLGTNPSSVWLIYWPQLVLFIAQATSGLLLISCIMWLRREKRTEL